MTLLATERFELPLLATGQAHKELFHNEALARIDFLIQPTVQAIATNPSSVDLSPGQAWIVGSAATGDWLDHDDQIAGWTGNGWLFIRPLPLMRVYIEPMDSFALYRGSWLLADDVQNPVAGAVVDAEARVAIDSILTALKAQGILRADS